MKEAIRQESDDLVDLLLHNGFNLNIFLDYKRLYGLYHDYFTTESQSVSFNNFTLF